MFPCRAHILPCRFPMYTAFPRSEYYQQVRLPLQLPLACGWSFQLTYSVFAKTVTGLPGSATLPFPPCHALRPRRSLRFSRHFSKIYCCLPSIRPCRPPNIILRGSIASLSLRPSFALSTLSLCCYLHTPKTRFQVWRLHHFPGLEFHQLDVSGLSRRTKKNLQICKDFFNISFTKKLKNHRYK